MLARAGDEIAVMKEWWSTRWYTPIIALAALLLVLLVAGLAVMEMLAPEAASVAAPDAWTAPLDQADVALARGDAAAAMSAWRGAQAAALRSGHWEGMIAVGDASRRLAEAGRDPLSRARVRTVADRWMSPPFEAEHRDPTLSGGHQP
jgi:hypothetical protein